MNYEDEKLLLEALRNGEEKAYVFLVDRFNKLLFGYALTLTKNSGTAEDIVQNVFLITWKNRKKLHIHSSLRNYLLRSIYNEFVNQYRKSRATIPLESKYFEGLEKAAQIHDSISLEKAIQLITTEIQNLPPKCRQVFELSRKDGLTNMEIAEYLDISIKTVEAQITKAFGFLRKRLKGKYEIIIMFIAGIQIEKLKQA